MFFFHLIFPFPRLGPDFPNQFKFFHLEGSFHDSPVYNTFPFVLLEHPMPLFFFFFFVTALSTTLKHLLKGKYCLAELCITLCLAHSEWWKYFKWIHEWMNLCMKLLMASNCKLSLATFVPKSMNSITLPIFSGLFEYQWDQCKWCKVGRPEDKYPYLLDHTTLSFLHVSSLLFFSWLSIMGNYLNYIKSSKRIEDEPSINHCAIQWKQEWANLTLMIKTAYSANKALDWRYKCLACLLGWWTKEWIF